MNRNVMITCALTGAGDTVGRSEHVPVTPEQIAESGIAAARAGATIVHIHVRDPETGQGLAGGRALPRGRWSGSGPPTSTSSSTPPRAWAATWCSIRRARPTFVEGTDLVSGVDRLPHVEELLPDICTLDCGSLNFGEGSLVYVSTPDMLREGAKNIQELGVRVEMEIFDTGHLWFAKPAGRGRAHRRPGDVPALHGHPVRRPGRPADCWPRMVNQLPEDAVWASFALGPMQMPWVAQSVLLGGHVRVGLEDNLYLSKGVKATNAQLVERARTIVEAMGAQVATPDEGREILALKPSPMTTPRAAPAPGGRPDRHLRRRRGDRRRLGGVLPGAGYAWLPGTRAEDAEARLRHLVDAAWPALTELGLAEGASPDPPARRAGPGDGLRAGRLRAGERARGPRAQADAARRDRRRAPGHVVISSSTSGYGMSEMQVACAHPERTVVGHPFNPPYLIPLVEVVGGTADLARGRRLDRRLLPARRQVRDHHGPRGARLHRQPAAGGAVARGAAHGRRR